MIATLSGAHPRHSIDSVMDHFLYCADLVGIEHVQHGFDDETIRAVIGGNIHRVLQSIWVSP